MRSLVDCHRCDCLIDASAITCPFCGASQRTTTAWSPVLVMALALSLGAATSGCVDKDDGDTTEQTTNPSTSNGPGTTTIPDGVTYAGPDETVSISDGSTTTTTTNTTVNTTTPDASTYAGPDETATLSSGGESSGGTEGTGGSSSGGSSSGGSSSGGSSSGGSSSG